MKERRNRGQGPEISGAELEMKQSPACSDQKRDDQSIKKRQHSPQGDPAEERNDERQLDPYLQAS